MSKAVLIVLVVMIGAGCLVPGSEREPKATPQAPAAPSFRVTSPSCDEGGGYVTWNAADDQNVPAPFVAADVRDDLGDPPLNGGAGSPLPNGNLTGAYHGTIWCPAYSIDGKEKRDLLIAFVGGRVQPPAFDPAPVRRQYAIAVIGVNDPDLSALWASMGLPLDPLLSASLRLQQGSMVSTMSFGHHGDIISVVPIKDHRAKPDETIRLWFHVSKGEHATGLYAMDMVDVGGTHLVASSVGHFDHRAPSSAPPVPGRPLHELPAWALAYRAVSRTIQPGPVVDVTVESEHQH